MRNVRNFWLTARVDGRANVVATGPRAKNGGMSLNLKVRDDGFVSDALSIECRAEGDLLVVLVFDRYGKRIGYVETQR